MSYVFRSCVEVYAAVLPGTCFSVPPSVGRSPGGRRAGVFGAPSVGARLMLAELSVTVPVDALPDVLEEFAGDVLAAGVTPPPPSLSGGAAICWTRRKRPCRKILHGRRGLI